MKGRLRRSELSTPATSEKMIGKAATLGADLVFLDLEDSVAPDLKEDARANVVGGLNDHDWGRTVRACRINGPSTPWCHGDLIEVVEGAGANLDVVIVPKVKAVRDVLFVDTLLTQLEDRLGLPVGRIGIEVLIEETEALARVEDIAACCDRLEALILGVGDLSASQGIRARAIGAKAQYPGDLWHFARNRIIVAARAVGIDAVDGPFADFRNPDGYREQSIWAATLGAVGKWCIHPSQIEIANDVFAPTAEEIEHAREVVAAMRAAEEGGQGAASMGGTLIDAASARMQEAVLERARQCGVL